jgi:hypothetical protein
LARRVRGVLFVDYVRMVRGCKHIDWTKHFTPEDVEVIGQRIDPEAWYPMETFERLGVGIVREIARGQLAAVHMWGRFQVDAVRVAHPTIIATGDPRDTMMRFQTMRRAFFDYDALEITEVLDDSASVSLRYGMGVEAERAACTQTLGLCERLVELAGGREVQAKFTACSWDGAPCTVIAVRWKI